MFKVVITSTKSDDIQRPLTVYAVRKDSMGRTQFLFYSLPIGETEREWAWRPASEFMPPFKAQEGAYFGGEDNYYYQEA